MFKKPADVYCILQYIVRNRMSEKMSIIVLRAMVSNIKHDPTLINALLSDLKKCSLFLAPSANDAVVSVQLSKHLTPSTAHPQIENEKPEQNQTQTLEEWAKWLKRKCTDNKFFLLLVLCHVVDLLSEQTFYVLQILNGQQVEKVEFLPTVQVDVGALRRSLTGSALLDSFDHDLYDSKNINLAKKIGSDIYTDAVEMNAFNVHLLQQSAPNMAIIDEFTNIIHTKMMIKSLQQGVRSVDVLGSFRPTNDNTLIVSSIKLQTEKMKSDLDVVKTIHTTRSKLVLNKTLETLTLYLKNGMTPPAISTYAESVSEPKHVMLHNASDCARVSWVLINHESNFEQQKKLVALMQSKQIAEKNKQLSEVFNAIYEQLSTEKEKIENEMLSHSASSNTFSKTHPISTDDLYGNGFFESLFMSKDFSYDKIDVFTYEMYYITTKRQYLGNNIPNTLLGGRVIKEVQKSKENAVLLEVLLNTISFPLNDGTNTALKPIFLGQQRSPGDSAFITLEQDSRLPKFAHLVSFAKRESLLYEMVPSETPTAWEIITNLPHEKRTLLSTVTPLRMCDFYHNTLNDLYTLNLTTADNEKIPFYIPGTYIEVLDNNKTFYMQPFAKKEHNKLVMVDDPFKFVTSFLTQWLSVAFTQDMTTFEVWQFLDKFAVLDVNLICKFFVHLYQTAYLSVEFVINTWHNFKTHIVIGSLLSSFKTWFPSYMIEGCAMLVFNLVGKYNGKYPLLVLFGTIFCISFLNGVYQNQKDTYIKLCQLFKSINCVEYIDAFYCYILMAVKMYYLKRKREDIFVLDNQFNEHFKNETDEHNRQQIVDYLSNTESMQNLISVLEDGVVLLEQQNETLRTEFEHGSIHHGHDYAKLAILYCRVVSTRMLCFILRRDLAGEQQVVDNNKIMELEKKCVELRNICAQKKIKTHDHEVLNLMERTMAIFQSFKHIYQAHSTLEHDIEHIKSKIINLWYTTCNSFHNSSHDNTLPHFLLQSFPVIVSVFMKQKASLAVMSVIGTPYIRQSARAMLTEATAYTDFFRCNYTKWDLWQCCTGTIELFYISEFFRVAFYQKSHFINPVRPVKMNHKQRKLKRSLSAIKDFVRTLNSGNLLTALELNRRDGIEERNFLLETDSTHDANSGLQKLENVHGSGGAPEADSAEEGSESDADTSVPPKPNYNVEELKNKLVHVLKNGTTSSEINEIIEQFNSNFLNNSNIERIPLFPMQKVAEYKHIDNQTKILCLRMLQIYLQRKNAVKNVPLIKECLKNLRNILQKKNTDTPDNRVVREMQDICISLKENSPEEAHASLKAVCRTIAN